MAQKIVDRPAKEILVDQDRALSAAAPPLGLVSSYHHAHVAAHSATAPETATPLFEQSWAPDSSSTT